MGLKINCGSHAANGPAGREIAPGMRDCWGNGSGLAGSQRLSRLAAVWQFLDGPAVAVRVAEEYERAPVELLDVADLHTRGRELRSRRADVGHDELQSLDRARCRIRRQPYFKQP
jgi:hypothetical protein